MKRLILGVGMSFLGLAAPVQAAGSFAGAWQTTFGPMTLTQQGERVEGSYMLDENHCTIAGRVKGGRLTFQYREPEVGGEGWFELAADGQTFAGKWRPQGATSWEAWQGRRAAAPEGPGFEGLWETTYGRLRLVREKTGMAGIYSYAGGSTLVGKVEGKRLVFRYKEPRAVGEAWFELAADGQGLRGKWKEEGRPGWRDWTGERVKPVPGRIWLVVVEARWEPNLAEREYAFGKMLRAFFARSDKVEVRHRFFTDEASLKRWCGEVAFLAEPAVLVLATHGSPKGVAVDGKTIGPQALADSFRYARNLRLLHFSACAILQDRFGVDLLQALDPQGRFPVSGYAVSVDWAASAIIEFTYLEMILVRGMGPRRAAAQVGKLLPFAGDKEISGAVFPAAKFRLLVPVRK